MPEHPISLGTDSDGHDRVLGFANPDTYMQTFGSRFNATMSGESVLQTVVHNPACKGVRVNSAKAEISLLIDREIALSPLHADKARLVHLSGDGGIFGRSRVG